MSILKNKDLDQKLCDFLEDNELRNLNSINEYYLKILDENFFKRRFQKNIRKELKGMNLYNENWKDFYFLVQKYIQNLDHVATIREIINEDRSDILQIMCEMFEYESRESIYGWENKNRDYIKPLKECVEKDKLKCFQYLYFQNPHYFELDLAFKSHAHNILRSYKQYLTRADKIGNLLVCFESGCMECYKCIDYSPDFAFQDEVIQYLHECYIEDILVGYKLTFKDFVNNIPFSKIVQYRNEAFHRGRQDIVALLTKYTSLFRTCF